MSADTFSDLRLLYYHETRPYNFGSPLKPHFWIVKQGFTRSIHYLSILLKKHRLWVVVRTASRRRFYWLPTIYVLSRNMKNIRIFIWKLSFFGRKIFNIFELACFCNDTDWVVKLQTTKYPYIPLFSSCFMGKHEHLHSIDWIPGPDIARCQFTRI